VGPIIERKTKDNPEIFVENKTSICDGGRGILCFYGGIRAKAEVKVETEEEAENPMDEPEQAAEAAEPAEADHEDDPP
jgi:hypothetical protein